VKDWRGFLRKRQWSNVDAVVWLSLQRRGQRKTRKYLSQDSSAETGIEYAFSMITDRQMDIDR
jgi:hypothetical protein